MQSDSVEVIKTVVRRCVQNEYTEKKGAVQIMNVQCTDLKQMYRLKHYRTHMY